MSLRIFDWNICIFLCISFFGSVPELYTVHPDGFKKIIDMNFGFENLLRMGHRRWSRLFHFIFVVWICLPYVRRLSKTSPRYLAVSEFGVGLLFLCTGVG